MHVHVHIHLHIHIHTIYIYIYIYIYYIYIYSGVVEVREYEELSITFYVHHKNHIKTKRKIKTINML